MNDPQPTPAMPSEPRAPVPASRGWIAWALAGLVLVVALGLAWDARQRVRTLEKELVRRQQDTQVQAGEARALAREAQDAARQAAARVALLDARLADATVQRDQVEELLASLARSHEDTVLAEIDAALRAAQQHAAITGSSEPLVAALRQADERLARGSDRRFERVRRAIARDLEAIGKAGSVDIAALGARLDDALRMVDDLPLLAQAGDAAGRPVPRGDAAAGSQAGAQGGAASAPSDIGWRQRALAVGAGLREQVWNEVRTLVRVTRIDHPEAALLAPEQQYFVRQSLRLRLLSARLALLARQYAGVNTDLRESQLLLGRYFDTGARRVVALRELLAQVATHATPVAQARPDETIAVLAAIGAGR